MNIYNRFNRPRFLIQEEDNNTKEYDFLVNNWDLFEMNNPIL